MAKTKREQQKSTPKGWFVNPSDDIKKKIAKRCEESMRAPAVEIAFLLREFFRREEEDARALADARSEAPPGAESASVTDFKKSMVGREP